MITKAADAFPSLLLARINLREMGRLFLSSLLSTVALCAAQQSTLVDLGYARYQGSINNESGNIEFLGIRYAAPPTGKLTHRDHPEFRLYRRFIRSFPVERATTAWKSDWNTTSRQRAKHVLASRGRERTRHSFSYSQWASSETCFASFLRRLFVPQVCTPQTLKISYELTRHTSIATPVAGNGSLPVVVWIHGFVISYLNHR